MNTTINHVQNVNIYNNTLYPSNVCSKCHQNKPLTEYNKDKSKTDGLRFSCKQCQSIQAKHYRENNKQINANKIVNKNDIKICSKCNLSNLITEYRKNITKSDGIQCYCKLCESIEDKLYRDNNRQINANKVFNDNDIKTCSKCKQQKLYTEFHKCVTEKSGLDKYFKDCKANDLKEYFRKECSTVFNKAINNNNNNCLSIIGCDAQF